MRLTLIFAACFHTCLLFAQPDISNTENRHIIILHTNDHHGHPFSFDYFYMKDVGGLAARATLINQVKSTHKNVLLLDAGDFNSGNIYSDYFDAIPDIVGYNYLGYDAVTIGNHEFDNDIPTLIEQINLADFSFISANVKIKKNRELIKPYIVKDISGISVAVIGLTLKESEDIGYPSIMKKVKIKDEIKIARKYVRKLEESVDLIVVLSHLGWYGNTHKGSYKLAREVKGIDIIIDGHTHTKMDSAQVVTHKNGKHKTIITTAWCNGLAVGKTDLWIKGDSISNYSFELLPVNLQQKVRKNDSMVVVYEKEQLVENEKLAKLLQPYNDTIETIFNKPIALIDSAIDFNSSNRNYNLKNLICESMMWYASSFEVDLSIVNMGCIRNTIPKGEVTLERIYSVLPFDNTLCILNIKGRELEKMMVHLNTMEKRGALPLFSDNIQFKLNESNQPEFKINGKKIIRKKNYRIVTTSYLAKGGDNYQFPNEKGFIDLSVYQREVLGKYLEKFY